MCAQVNHNHIHPGHSYIYEHFRQNGQVISVYLGSSDNVHIASSIPAKGYPVEAECYKEGHQAGIQAEKEVYGEKRYKEFNEHINKVVPKGELAGSHTEQGEILIHKNIDPKYHKQLILHEKTEHEYMEAKMCNAELMKSKHYPPGAGRYYELKQMGAKPRTKTISNRRIEAALRHPDILGAGADKRRSLPLTKEEHIEAVRQEYLRGTLHSSSGKKVTSEKQMYAIAYSELREKGHKIPQKE